MDRDKVVHPYIPNSVSRVQGEMLTEIGAKSIDELYKLIPDDLLFKGKLNIPDGYQDEYSLRRHMNEILDKNVPTSEKLSFLGGGCSPHYVPAICDVINSRSEFLTAYAGEPYEDHGRFQALFEYASMLGELVDMDVVSVPTYDGSQAAASALRMACRITGRSTVIIPRSLNLDRSSIIKNYCYPQIDVITVDYDARSGLIDLSDLKEKLSEGVAAVYIETPSFLGVIETNAAEVSDLAHENGALSIVGVDPISLGVLAPPPQYGADLVCGELQSLGIHMYYGGARGGFIASVDEERIVSQYPTRLFGIVPTVDKAWGFGDVAWERTSFARREDSKEYVGTMAALWGITAGVYLALMGPQGMHDVGHTIMERSAYAVQELGKIAGVTSPALRAPFFQEFVVNLDDAAVTARRMNEKLLKRGIYGGIDLSRDFPKLGESLLLSVTEVHTKQDIDRLVTSMRQIVEGR
ncbi:MAG: aminomethyl-transferring glycine dehydrogenase subunit GcvPA [Candidatus Bipolaricaulota bacterium]|nr:aminomethyl-transferring glycine dehydrogenase subunit GcvPA [Candidatus Bipolaricaulota bacterium]